MGRGLGPLQRRILDYLASPPAGGRCLALELELALFEDSSVGPSRAQVVSLRRAIAALTRRGLTRTGYEAGLSAPSSLHLLVWLAGQPTPNVIQRRRWREQEAIMLDVLRRITHDEVDTWLASARGVRGYDRKDSAWTQNQWHASAAVPYQLAVERIVAVLGGRDARGRLTPSTSRAIRQALRRLARSQLITLGWSESRGRIYQSVRYAPPDEFVWQERPRRSLDEPLRVLVRRTPAHQGTAQSMVQSQPATSKHRSFVTLGTTSRPRSSALPPAGPFRAGRTAKDPAEYYRRTDGPPATASAH